MAKRAIIWSAVSTRPQADEDEKFSIPKQIEDGQRISASQGWQVVDILKVPGHSRDYRSLDKLAADARKQNIDAFDKLIQHFERKDFDVFICRDANRFARKASLLHYIAETIIEDCGAIIYDQSNNLYVDEELLPMWATLQGYKTRAEIKWLVDARKNGMIKRAQKGLPTTSHGLIYSHIVTKTWDAKGEELIDQRVVVNEDARRLFIDVAEFLLAGVSWGQMSRELAARGHRRDGKIIHAGSLRDWLMHPTAWGNSATHFMDDTHFRTTRGFWVFDPHEPRPDYVQIWYGTHEPIYTGELAIKIQAELRRRFGLNGKAHPAYSNKFTGLVVCKDCHYAMGYKKTGEWIGIHCTSRYARYALGKCKNRQYINEKKAVEAAGEVLSGLVASGDWTRLVGKSADVDQTKQQLAGVETDLIEVNGIIDMLIKQQEDLPELSDNYTPRLKIYGEQKTELLKEQQRLKALQQRAEPKASQISALEEFKKIDPETFWQFPDYEINQWLFRILGEWRFVADKGEITGLSDEPRYIVQRRV